eukprot:CAMPEP_0116045120 /NCGR_PEP_ID=MMETSP0321-20121206/27415_1 /TAXON_ID=163516 /ORGANISM="Leptocylindrus danicus var. danicus, Strain B650" /LENGTH=631 /DNA_ID=CAMNT_0003526365 /DNA_START=342 /DNA_END=2237 /DNA_ORIENTATION=-
MGQCATLPYNHHHGNNNNNNNNGYYHNAVYKETAADYHAHAHTHGGGAVSAYAMQDAAQNPHHHGHHGHTATESSHSVGNGSENSNTPLMTGNHNGQMNPVGQGYHHGPYNQGNKQYVPPPSGAFPTTTNTTNTPPRVPNSPANSTSKKRKSTTTQSQVMSIPEQGGTSSQAQAEEQNNDLFEQIMTPFVPDGATPKRCFRLNLGQQQQLLSPNGMPIQYSMSEESSVATNPNQMVESTAKIFRGLKVTRDGTVISTHHGHSSSKSKKKGGSSSSSKHQTKVVVDAKSRQAAKIDKLKELVENTDKQGGQASNANANGGSSVSKSSNNGGGSSNGNNAKSSSSKGKKDAEEDQKFENNQMLSLVVMGEYFDMKKLVRDGAKKLQEAEAGISSNTAAADSQQPSQQSQKQTSESGSNLNVSRHATSPRSSSRHSHSNKNKHNSPTISTRDRDHRKQAQSDDKNSNSNSKYHRRYSSGNRTKTNINSPPKLNRHPRDTPPRSARYQPQCSAFGTGGGGSDWSEALGFSQGLKSFWGCGGGAEHASAANMSGFRSDLAKRSYSPTAERRDEAHHHHHHHYHAREKYSSYGNRETDVRMSAPDDMQHDVLVDEPMQQRDTQSSNRIGSVEVSMMH